MARSVQQTQRQLIACALEVLADADFALAGSGAIREHGMTQRPTNDIDLFTVMQASTRFPHAVDSLIEHLTANNYDVTVERRTPTFAQLSVTPPHEPPLSVDLAIDWRAHTPVRLDIGPVLTLEDAIGNKLSALYSRATHATTSTSMRSAPPEQSQIHASSSSCRNVTQASTQHSSQNASAEHATSP